MPPSTFSEADIQLLHEPPKSVKRAQLATLCRKASVKIKGTNAALIAALNAAVYSDVADQENVDPSPTRGTKDVDEPVGARSVSPDDESDKSMETVIHYTKPNIFWSESTPAASLQGRRKTSQRSVASSKSMTGSLYPDLSTTYPDLSAVKESAPTTSTEDFGKIADVMLEEMNARVAAKQAPPKPTPTPSTNPIFKDVRVPFIDSPSLSNIDSNKHRFSDAHNKIFTQMDSVETHYAAQRDRSDSVDQSDILPSIRIAKRRLSNADSPQISPKRIRSEVDEKVRYFEGRREESMSEQGRQMQNLMRQELQKRLLGKLGTEGEADDSIELETRRMPGKTGINNHKLTLGKTLRNNPRGKVIPVKSASSSNIATDSDDSPSLSTSYSIQIHPPSLMPNEPSIRLLPGNESILPKEKMIPTKHTPQTSNMGSRALVIPAAKTPKKTILTSKPDTRSQPVASSPSKMQLSPYKSATFTMGAIPTNSKPTARRKSQRIIAKAVPAPTTKPRIARKLASRATGKELTIRAVQPEPTDIQVPVKFNGRTTKRKYADGDASPSKRTKLNENSSFTPVRKIAPSYMTPSMTLVRHANANSVTFTPGAISSRTTSSRVYGRAAARRPPWR